MPKFNVLRLTALTYSIFIAAIILLFLSIAEIVLEERVQHAFHTIQTQYPGSSLAEWLFVPMKPNYIDAGPATAKFTIGACGLGTALLAMAWIGGTWWGGKEVVVKKLGVWSCIASVFSTAGVIGFMIYVFVVEAQNKLPQFFIDWHKASFTREFWVCTAFPSVFDDAETLYGLPACDIALAAKHELIGICCVSVVLAGLSVLQMPKNGAFKWKESDWDIEAMKASLKSDGTSRGSRNAKLPKISTHLQEAVTVPSWRNSTLQRPPAVMQVDRSGLHGFYGRV